MVSGEYTCLMDSGFPEKSVVLDNQPRLSPLAGSDRYMAGIPLALATRARINCQFAQSVVTELPLNTGPTKNLSARSWFIRWRMVLFLLRLGRVLAFLLLFVL